MNGRDLNEKPVEMHTQQPQNDAKYKPNRIVLLSPGKIVSCSYLIAKNKFRYIKQNNMSGAALAKETFRQLEKENMGKLESFSIRQNNVQVKCFTNFESHTYSPIYAR